MRILVTGAAGFVASHLCDRLLANGHEVIGVDIFLTGRKENLTQASKHPGFHLMTHDITRPLQVEGSVDGIYHLASPASPADYMRHGIHTMKVGGLGTLYMLGLARAKSARFLLASTSEVYGDPLEHPQRETYWGNVNPIGPRGVYDEAKRFAEALTMAYHRTHGVDVRIARIFNTYGPRMRLNDGRAVCTFVTQALRGEDLSIHGAGTQTRSFCYVDDLVDALVRLFESLEVNPVNLGNPDEVRIIDLAREVLELSESKSGLRFEERPLDDPSRRKPDISRAQKLLNWNPKVPRREGLRLTIADFRSRI